MRRFDFSLRGLFVRIGRYFYGVDRFFPFVCRVPIICGGTEGVDESMSSQDTYISVGDNESPNSYTEIAHIKSIGGPNETSEEIDVTHLRSTGGYREFLQSFKDGGELPLTTNFLPGATTHQTIRTLFASGDRRGWKVTYPDGSNDTFVAYVKGVGRTAGVGNALDGSFTLRIIGPVTLDPA